jgi:acetyl esterase/lipase
MTEEELLAQSLGDKVTLKSDIKYKEGDDVHERHVLDLYLPKNVKNFPVVFFVHGGAWQGGEKRHGKAIARGICEDGWGIVSINYRLANAEGTSAKYPHFCEDSAAAFAWTYKNIASYGGDEKRIFVAGHSAGGHIGACITYNEKFLEAHKLKNSEVIRGFIGLSGVYDIPAVDDPDVMKAVAGNWMSFAFPVDEETRKDASPVNFVDADDPPALVFYCVKGDLMGIELTTKHMNEVLTAAKVGHRIRAITGRTHNTLLSSFGTADDPAKKACIEFTKAVLDNKDVSDPEPVAVAAAGKPGEGVPAKPVPAPAKEAPAGSTPAVPAPAAPAPKAAPAPAKAA